MGNANQFAGGSYLKPEDVTEPIKVKVLECFESVDFNSQPCLVLKIEGAEKEKFQLNRTNVGIMIELFGDDFDKWSKKEIGLSPATYEFKEADGTKKKGPTIKVTEPDDLPF